MVERDETTTVQLKFRVKERLRAELEQAARRRGASLNAEIVARLDDSLADPHRLLNPVSIAEELAVTLMQLQEIHTKVLDLARDLPQGDSNTHRTVIDIARDLSSCTTRLFAKTCKLLTRADEREPSR